MQLSDDDIDRIARVGEALLLEEEAAVRWGYIIENDGDSFRILPPTEYRDENPL